MDLSTNSAHLGRPPRTANETDWRRVQNCFCTRLLNCVLISSEVFHSFKNFLYSESCQTNSRSPDGPAAGRTGLITTLALMSLMSNNLMLDYQELQRHLDVIQLYQGKIIRIKHFACEGHFQTIQF